MFWTPTTLYWNTAFALDFHLSSWHLLLRRHDMTRHDITKRLKPSILSTSACVHGICKCSYIINLHYANQICLPILLRHKGAQKEGGGPNVFMREALNLVDFFVSNYLTQDVDLSTLEVSVGLLPRSFTDVCRYVQGSGLLKVTTSTHVLVAVWYNSVSSLLYSLLIAYHSSLTQS